MKAKTILGLLSTIFFLSSMSAHAEVLIVESDIENDYIDSLQFSLNNDHYGICTSVSLFCPTRSVIKIDPNKEYLFYLYNYDGPDSDFTINESCREKTIIVQPHRNKSITVELYGSDIVCKYSL